MHIVAPMGNCCVSRNPGEGEVPGLRSTGPNAKLVSFPSTPSKKRTKTNSDLGTAADGVTAAHKGCGAHGDDEDRSVALLLLPTPCKESGRQARSGEPKTADVSAELHVNEIEIAKPSHSSEALASEDGCFEGVRAVDSGEKDSSPGTEPIGPAEHKQDTFVQHEHTYAEMPVFSGALENERAGAEKPQLLNVAENENADVEKQACSGVAETEHADHESAPDPRPCDAPCGEVVRMIESPRLGENVAIAEDIASEVQMEAQCQLMKEDDGCDVALSDSDWSSSCSSGDDFEEYVYEFEPMSSALADVERPAEAAEPVCGCEDSEPEAKPDLETNLTTRPDAVEVAVPDCGAKLTSHVVGEGVPDNNLPSGKMERSVQVAGVRTQDASEPVTIGPSGSTGSPARASNFFVRLQERRLRREKRAAKAKAGGDFLERVRERRARKEAAKAAWAAIGSALDGDKQ